jgi:hypothetical protein
MKRKPPKFESEAALVAAYCTYVDRINYAYRHLPESHMRWTVYAETAGFDLLLVQDVTGVQVGIEAKLTLNLKVLEQALPSRYDGFHRPSVGPDYRAVLDLRGYVTRSDMRALGISATRWCGYQGFLKPNPDGPGWVRCDLTPDFRAQHERVYAEVAADFKNWAGNIALTLN